MLIRTCWHSSSARRQVCAADENACRSTCEAPSARLHTACIPSQSAVQHNACTQLEAYEHHDMYCTATHTMRLVSATVKECVTERGCLACLTAMLTAH